MFSICTLGPCLPLLWPVYLFRFIRKNKNRWDSFFPRGVGSFFCLSGMIRFRIFVNWRRLNDSYWRRGGVTAPRNKLDWSHITPWIVGAALKPAAARFRCFFFFFSSGGQPPSPRGPHVGQANYGWSLLTLLQHSLCKGMFALGHFVLSKVPLFSASTLPRINGW